MQTLVVNTRHCPAAGKEVQVEEIYHLQGTGTCQIDTQLVSWRCLDENGCPQAGDCPLYREYAGTGEKSMLDR